MTFDYFFRSKREKGGFIYSCKKCSYRRKKKYRRSEQSRIIHKEYNKKYRQSLHGSRVRQEGRLKYKHGLTLEQYDQMFEQQDGLCAVCRNINGDGRRLAIDHNHQTGKIRGLLCFRCNTWLGILENKEFTINAKKYLREFDPNSALLLDMEGQSGVLNPCPKGEIE